MIGGRRRLVGTLAASALAAPAARAQQGKPARIVVLARSPIPELSAFREQMRELGWVEGRTWAIEERYAGGSTARLREQAAAAVGSGPDVIVAGHHEAVLALKALSSTVPIVFNIGGSDPVGAGLIASFARPGGNATGIASSAADLSGKRVQILHDAFPTVKRVAFLHTGSSATFEQSEAARAVAAQLHFEILPVPVEEEAALGPALDAVLDRGAEAIATSTSPMFRSASMTIVAIAARRRVPAIYEDVATADAGGLMAYGADFRQIARRMAFYVDRILRGAKPADLPVERQERIEFAINLKTAAAMGFDIPPIVLTRADRVIE